MTYYCSLGTRLIHVVDNKEIIVGVIHSDVLLQEIICLLNKEN